MLAVVAPEFTEPPGYQLLEVEKPAIASPRDVIVEVYAASINPVDVKLASGAFKAALPESFPLRIGYDCAGIVREIGSEVSRLKVGDHVWSRLPEVGKGSWAQFVRAPEDHISLKPEKLSWEEAASLPLAALTSLQALEKYQGSLAGKTVFVPAALGGTGAFACQLAKRTFKAGKVITTVSTSKIPRVPELLGEGVVDEIIDYTKQDPLKVIPAGTVDFMLDTMGQAMNYLSLMRPGTSTIVSISTLPSGSQFQNASFFKRPDNPRVPFYVRLFLDAGDYIRKFRARGINYTYMFLESDATSLDKLRQCVDEGQVRPVIGRSISLQNIEQVREGCLEVYSGKGGIGKTVFKVK